MVPRSSCRLQVVVTRILPRLFRSISGSRCEEVSRLYALSASDTSSAGESSSADGPSSSDTEEEEGAHAHHSQVLRAYLRNRRARCLGRVREQGLVPAVLVDGDKERRPKDGGSTDVFLSLDAKPLVGLLKHIGKRDFISRVFDMNIYRSFTSTDLHESLQVLPRNLNYGPGKTNILNVQFIRANPEQSLKLGVPLEYLGLDQCPGLRKGGTLNKLAKYVVYNCKATELPAKIVVDMTVLEIGDRVQVQDLEVDFDRLHSDRTMPICEIVKDVSSLRVKVRKLKTELHFKNKAVATKESDARSHLLSDDEVEVDAEHASIRYQRPREAMKKSPRVVSSKSKVSGYMRKGRVSEQRRPGPPLLDDEADDDDDEDIIFKSSQRQKHVWSESPAKNPISRAVVKKRTLSERQKLHAQSDGDEFDFSSDDEVQERQKGTRKSTRSPAGSLKKGRMFGQRKVHLSSEDEGSGDEKEVQTGSGKDRPYRGSNSRVSGPVKRQGKVSRRRLQGTPFKVNKATE